MGEYQEMMEERRKVRDRINSYSSGVK